MNKEEILGVETCLMVENTFLEKKRITASAAAEIASYNPNLKESLCTAP